MRFFRVALLLLPLVVSETSVAQFIGIDAQSAALVENTVTQRMQSAGIVGCSVGIVKAGRIVYARGFGYRDLDNRFPATEYTIYRTGSIAKTFTAVLALQLAEAGRLRLDEDVRTLVPEYPAKPQGPMKIGHLLTHRSGIRHYVEYDSALLASYETTHGEYDAIGALDIFKNGSISFKPGTAYQYTTFGFNLLGAVLERAAGTRFQDLLEQRIRRRLSLPYLQPEVGRLRPYPEETKGYDYESGTLRQTLDNTGILYKVPGGGMVCTVLDLCHFMRGMMDGRVFDSTGTLDVMGTVLSPEGAYGLGYFIGSWNGHRTLSHGGGQEKTYSHYIFVPDTHDGVVVMTNTFRAPADPLGRAILDLLPSLVATGDTIAAVAVALDTPSRVYPDMNEVMYAASVPLQWTPVRHADRYAVQTDRSPLFTAPRNDTVRNVTDVVSGLMPAATYYWRVRALNPFLHDTARSAWSGTWQFQTPFVTGFGGLRAIPSGSALRVYPNPARHRVAVQFMGWRHPFSTCSLWSMDGKLRATWDSTPYNGVLDVSGLEAGTYVLTAGQGAAASAATTLTIVK
ncbi:MAG: serine hydrolase [Ignavibacteria bacterium]|nr:serine hydrolase [Ignavibacteria bacterium]